MDTDLWNTVYHIIKSPTPDASKRNSLSTIAAKKEYEQNNNYYKKDEYYEDKVGYSGNQHLDNTYTGNYNNYNQNSTTDIKQNATTTIKNSASYIVE